MAKIAPDKAVLFIPYGYPGSGRTHFANLFSDSVNAAHLSDDRLRQELFDKPTFDKQEDDEMGLISADSASSQVIKPGLVNLVPQLRAGRVDESRRNIVIR